MKKIILSFVVYSLFSILYSLPLHAVKAYPNPWIPESKTEGNKHGTWDGVRFDGLAATGGTIHIYNTTGELVRKVTWETGTSTYWDGRNDRHEYVASGVYIWVIKDGGNASGKIVVIR